MTHRNLFEKVNSELRRLLGHTLLAPLFLVALALPAVGPEANAQVSVVAIGVFDDQKPSGTPSPNVSVDMIRDTCASGDSASQEPFFDTYVAITVRNQGTATARLSRLSYEVSRAQGSRTYRSPNVAFSGLQEVPPGETITAYAPIFIHRDNQKRFPSSRISGGMVVGLKTVTFRIGGTSGTKAFVVRAATTLSFGNYDRCE
jgi:hypothetical protein